MARFAGAEFSSPLDVFLPFDATNPPFGLPKVAKLASSPAERTIFSEETCRVGRIIG
jgi:hypothetical protein